MRQACVLIFALLAVVGPIHAQLIEGRVRLPDGQPVAYAQVRLFDRSDLRRSIGTTTDETGHFVLSLHALSGGHGAA